MKTEGLPAASDLVLGPMSDLKDVDKDDVKGRFDKGRHLDKLTCTFSWLT